MEDNALDELNQIRKPRITVWCSYNGWTDLRFINGYWEAKPPGENEFMLVPSIAWKPPFPGNLPKT